MNKKALTVNLQMRVCLQYATAIQVLLVLFNIMSTNECTNYAKKIANCHNMTTGE